MIVGTLPGTQGTPIERLYCEWSFSNTRTGVKTEHPEEMKITRNEQKNMKYRNNNSSVIH